MKLAGISCFLFVVSACGGEAGSAAGSAKASASSSSAPKKDDKFAQCASDKLKNCRQYSGMNLAGGTESLKGLCESSKQIVSDSTWKEEACPTAKVIASCDMKMHKDFYYEGAEGLESTEKFCKDGGHTWEKK